VAALAALVVLEFAAATVLPAAIWSVGILRLLELGLWFGYWKTRGWSLADLGLSGDLALRGWVFGVGLSAGFGALVGVVELCTRMFGGWSFLGQLSGPLRSGTDLATLLAVGALVAPLFEEVVFRGLLFGGLRKRMGPVTATIAVTLLFALAHSLSAPVPWVQAVGGVLFCAAYEFSGSLWAPIIVHTTGNLAIFLLPLWVS
jgi:membrane protease YdiL (CAAX protease family)